MCRSRLVKPMTLVLVVLLANLTPAEAQQRGLEQIVHVQTPAGDALTLYAGGSYALLIGVSDYTASWPDLTQVQRELDDVEAVLQAQGFSTTRVRNPTSKELKQSFEDFFGRYRHEAKARLLVFFSGHGYTRKNGRRGYLVPADAPDPLADEPSFLRNALSMDDIFYWARVIEEDNHVLFLFDSCFSGTVFKTRSLPKPPPYIDRLTAEPVRQFITAGSADEEVPAQSVFTPKFVDALRYGQGDLNQDGYVTGTELGLYLQAEVPKYTLQSPQYGKIQDERLGRGDFVFVTVRAAPDPPQLSGEDSTLAAVRDALQDAIDLGVNEFKLSRQHKLLDSTRQLVKIATRTNYQDLVEKIESDIRSRETSADRLLKRYGENIAKLSKFKEERVQEALQSLHEDRLTSSSKMALGILTRHLDDYRDARRPRLETWRRDFKQKFGDLPEDALR